MGANSVRRRAALHVDGADFLEALRRAERLVGQTRFNEAFDICEDLIHAHPDQSAHVLALAYDWYQRMPERNRYNLYQSRYYDFDIRPGQKVLDIGSGHLPFPYATHLADLATDDDAYGRAGAPIKRPDGKEVIKCNVEDMLFADGEFDFVYCSHVLEHAHDPAKACRELMRVGRSGYIETPTPAKDLWLNSAGISNHRWGVECIDDTLVFTEYTDAEIRGVGCSILMAMHTAPATVREKAFAALVWLKSDMFNTMFMWEKEFAFRVNRRKKPTMDSSPPIAETSFTSSRPPRHGTNNIVAHLNSPSEEKISVPDPKNSWSADPNDDAFSQDNAVPRVFAVETALHCNLKCPECAIGSGVIRRERGLMSYDDYLIIAEKIRPHAKY
ncbi:MAG: methyltransferase domain-containing protein, partial [Chitinivibrionales bacterium]|nr:methyltransferase domain-containing protein [Chitinivibrionales bacterium]MBD3356325.1 methyltransferase domain-containing protein [Chitinivibrionales bacterium]